MAQLGVGRDVLCEVHRIMQDAQDVDVVVPAAPIEDEMPPVPAVPGAPPLVLVEI